MQAKMDFSTRTKRKEVKTYRECPCKDATTYQALLSAAGELFARKGYSETPVREIVAAAGVTKPALYYYFRNKEGIYLALFRESFAKLTAFLDDFAGRGESATNVLRRFCEGLHFLFCEHVELLDLLRGFPPGTPLLHTTHHQKRILETLRYLIRKATEEGEFEKGAVEEKAALILGAVYMASHSGIRNRITLPRILDVLFKSDLRRISKKKLFIDS